MQPFLLYSPKFSFTINYSFKFILVISCLILAFRAPAQTIKSQKALTPKGYGPAIISTADGGYLIASNDSALVRLNKIDQEGNSVWEKSLERSGFINTVVSTNDGGYVLGGNLNNDFWVIRLDKGLSKVWEKSFGGDKEDVLSSIVANKDGSFLLGGTSYSDSSGTKTQDLKAYSDYWIVKIDGSGSKLWDKSFGGVKSHTTREDIDPFTHEIIYDTLQIGYSSLNNIIITPDNGYLLAGSSNSIVGGDKTTGMVDTSQYVTFSYWVIKIDKNGKTVWDNSYSTGHINYLSTIINTTDGGYLLGGSEVFDEGPYGIWYNYAVIKINSFGEPLWSKTFETANYSPDDNLTSLVNTKDGGYLIGGYSASYPGYNSEKTEDSKGWYDYWVIKVNQNGDKVWDKTYGGYNEDYLLAIFPTTDGNYFLFGTSASGISGDKKVQSKGYNNYWLLKIKDDKLLPNQWNLRYGGSGNEGFTAVIKTSDGGYLSGGYTNSGVSGDKTQSSQGKNDFWIIKSDKNGKKLWDKRYGGSEDEYLNRIIQTQDGGYLLAGSSLSEISGDKTQASRGGRDYWIVKISNTGVKQWDKRFGGTGYDELKKVLQLSTGEYILAGYSNSPAGGNKSQASQGGYDYWIIKISSTGSQLWDKRFGGSLNETLGGIVQTSDGGFLLGGSSTSGKSGDKTQVSRGGSDFWLVRIDKNGNKIWDKTYGGSGQDEVYSVGKSGSSEFFISGQSDSPAGGDKTRDSQGGLDFWFIKITGTGAKVWDKRFGGTLNEELRASIQTSDGGYILAGKSFSNKGGNITQNSQGSSDYWIVKTDKDGMYQWDKRYGGSGAEELRAVIQTSDGGLLLAGKSDSGVSGDRTQPSQGGTDYWLVKVAPENSPIITTREAMEVEQPVQENELSLLQAYPNPFKEQINISFTLPQTEPAQVKIYDSQGREIATLFSGEAQANQTYQVKWQPGNQAAGIYLLQLQTPNQRQHQKLLLTK